jgi:hypothetical protein
VRAETGTAKGGCREGRGDLAALPGETNRRSAKRKGCRQRAAGWFSAAHGPFWPIALGAVNGYVFSSPRVSHDPARPGPGGRRRRLPRRHLPQDETWRQIRQAFKAKALGAVGVKEALTLVRSPQFQWPPNLYSDRLFEVSF